MISIFSYAVYLFLYLLEFCIIATVVLSIFPYMHKLRRILMIFLEPVYSVVRYLMKHSTYYSKSIDMTPFIALLIISFLRTLLLN